MAFEEEEGERAAVVLAEAREDITPPIIAMPIVPKVGLGCWYIYSVEHSCMWGMIWGKVGERCTNLPEPRTVNVKGLDSWAFDIVIVVSFWVIY